MKKLNWGIILTAIGIAIPATVYIVNLRADLNNHLKTDTAIEQRINQLEKTVYNDPGTHIPSCQTAKIVGLSDRKTGINRTTRIEWTPANCKMVVQAYMDGALINEFEKVPKFSGEVTLGDVATGNDHRMRIGMVELKIWVPGSDKPSDEGVWVKVE